MSTPASELKVGDWVQLTGRYWSEGKMADFEGDVDGDEIHQITHVYDTYLPEYVLPSFETVAGEWYVFPGDDYAVTKVEPPK